MEDRTSQPALTRPAGRRLAIDEALRRVADSTIPAIDATDRELLKRELLARGSNPVNVERIIRDRVCAAVAAQALLDVPGPVSMRPARVHELVEVGMAALPSWLQTKDYARDFMGAVAAMINHALKR